MLSSFLRAQSYCEERDIPSLMHKRPRLWRHVPERAWWQERCSLAISRGRDVCHEYDSKHVRKFSAAKYLSAPNDGCASGLVNAYYYALEYQFVGSFLASENTTRNFTITINSGLNKIRPGNKTVRHSFESCRNIFLLLPVFPCFFMFFKVYENALMNCIKS